MYKRETNRITKLICECEKGSGTDKILGKMVYRMKKKKSIGLKVLIACIIALVLGGGLGAVNIAIEYWNEVREEQNIASVEGTEGTEENTIPTKPVSAMPATIQDVSTVVDNAMPFIVSIRSEVVQTSQDIFGRRSEQIGVGAGSGIIIGQSSKELLLVTNEHVISDARKITVTFDDGSEHEAELKGSDVNSDLAVLSIKLSALSKETKSHIRIASLGDSNHVQTGAMAIAIGNALGYGQSTTVGYISATERTITVNNVERSLIQTDAAINPGNSGGALLNVRGEVIGINSVKYASEEVEGIGYAIPISEAIPIINDLMGREELTEKEAGFLGIQGQTVTSSYSLLFGIPVGVYINTVVSGSPAEDAGLKTGDIIVKVNGRSISTSEDLQTILDYTRAGTTVTVTVSTVSGREYEEEDYLVTLGRR